MHITFLKRLASRPVLLSAALAALICAGPVASRAQTPPAQPEAVSEAPQPLSADELEILVARIALYPDELVALISSASLFPLQIIEAQRFLDESKTKKDMKPKPTWDGSVVSLMNYPEVVKMMSDDLDWTQTFGEAIVNQQDDVLAAIQQLREEAVANGIIKTDDKVKVVQQNENIVIQPASTEVIYVPQYQPEMLYDTGYPYEPVSYYPDPYPYYWNPGAAFFAGAVTGVIWGAVVDWDDGFWGGNWGWGGNNDIDFDFDCNQCIIGNDFSGKLNWNDVDWRNVDRSKIKFDKNQFAKIDNTKFKDSFKNTDRNRLTNKASNIKGNRPTTLPGKGARPAQDIRKSTLEGLQKKPVANFKPTDKMARPGDLARPAGGLKAGDKMATPKIDRPVGKPKAGLAKDSRPKNPSPMGDYKRGRDAKVQSARGNKSMGGGINRPQRSGGGAQFSAPKHKMGGGGGGGGGKRIRRR